MAIYIGRQKYSTGESVYRGFWAVTVYGITGTVVVCGQSKTIGETGFVIFRFAEPGTYIFTATNHGNTKTATVTLDDTSGVYFYSINMYILPTGYIPLQYIESSGTQYIDTGIKIKGTDVVKFKYQYLSTTTQCRIFGYGNATPRFLITTGNGLPTDNIQFGYGSAWIDSTITPGVDLNSIIVGNGSLQINDETPITFTTFDTEVAENALLFGAKYNGRIVCTSADIYEVIITRGSADILHFIPAKRESDEMVGMYNGITQSFFVDVNGGNFIAGPEIV